MLQLVLSTVLLTQIGVHATPEQADEPDDDSLSEFVYPGATTRNGTVIGSEDSFVYNSIMATTDDLESVVEYYSTKTGHELAAETTGISRQRVSGRDGSWFFFHDDSALVSSNEARGVTIRYFAKDTKDYHISLVISRVPAEAHTHIVLTHVKK